MPGQIYSARRQLLSFLSVCFFFLFLFFFVFFSSLLLFMFATFFRCQSRWVRWHTEAATIVKYMTRVVYVIFCKAQIVGDSSWQCGVRGTTHTYTDIRTSYHAVANFLEGIFGSMEARLLAELYVQLNFPLPHLWLLRLGLRLKLSQRQPWPSLTWIYEIIQIHVTPYECVCVWHSYRVLHHLIKFIQLNK